VRLMPAQYVKPYVKTNKNDYIDAEAIAEAVTRPTMRFVPIKTDDQLDLQSLYRIRERWVKGRTAVIVATLFPILINSFTDCIRFLQSLSARRAILAAENLFLRKQLAFYQEHRIRPRRLTATARFSLLFWSRFCDWRNALVIVKPETLIGWHHKGFKLFWKWQSRPRRPAFPSAFVI
jgi:transposase